MSISSSQRFVYFQNKAKHYHQLRNIRSSIDNSPPKSQIPKTKVFRSISYNKQHQIEFQNEHLIERIVNIAKCQRTQVAADGKYSRFNKVQRPFREQIPLKNQKERVITIDNCDLKKRVRSVKPAIGSTSLWNQQYQKFLNNKKNISRYIENSKSKAQLHISTQKFVPQHLRDYALRKQSLNISTTAKEKIIPFQKLFQLPPIDRKEKKISLPNNQLHSSLKRIKSEEQLQPNI